MLVTETAARRFWPGEEVIGKQHVVANPPETEARIRALHAKALAGEVSKHANATAAEKEQATRLLEALASAE